MTPATPPSPLAPVFLYGSLRSGTTVFRLMLEHHPDIYNPGEVDVLFDHLAPDPGHPTGWRYDREALGRHRIFRAQGLRMPSGLDGLDLLHDFLAQFADRASGRLLTMNLHRHAERAILLLPEARMIHLLRDPRDVARSSIGMGWCSLSYFGVDHWMETERDWDRATLHMASEASLTVRFETLMTSLEPELRRVCDFLGLDFHDDMLRYHETTTYGPPDPRIAQQWKRKSDPREIALIEGKCGDLMEARGYALSASPDIPGPLRLFHMKLRNEIGTTRFNARRFGLGLVIGLRLSRRLGLSGSAIRLQRVLDDKKTQLLK